MDIKPGPTTVEEELTAMRRIVATLNKIDREAQDRIASWVYDRYRLSAQDAPTIQESQP